MTNKSFELPKVKTQNGFVVLPLKKWQKMEKEKWEMGQAVEAILAGELELRDGKTRSFKEFLAARHAKNMHSIFSSLVR